MPVSCPPVGNFGVWKITGTYAQTLTQTLFLASHRYCQSKVFERLYGSFTAVLLTIARTRGRILRLAFAVVPDAIGPGASLGAMTIAAVGAALGCGALTDGALVADVARLGFGVAVHGAIAAVGHVKCGWW